MRHGGSPRTRLKGVRSNADQLFGGHSLGIRSRGRGAIEQLADRPSYCKKRRTHPRQGRLVDALHPIVREHVDWFCWPERHVLLEDIERLERSERLERHKA